MMKTRFSGEADLDKSVRLPALKYEIIDFEMQILT